MSLLMHTLHVDLGERSYPVYIGRDLLSDPQLLAQPPLLGKRGHAGSLLLGCTCQRLASMYSYKLWKYDKSCIDGYGQQA